MDSYFSFCKENYSMETLDNIDIKILKCLQENCKLTTKELAAKISLSPTPTFERVKNFIMS